MRMQPTDWVAQLLNLRKIGKSCSFFSHFLTPQDQTQVSVKKFDGLINFGLFGRGAPPLKIHKSFGGKVLHQLLQKGVPRTETAANFGNSLAIPVETKIIAEILEGTAVETFL